MLATTLRRPRSRRPSLGAVAGAVGTRVTGACGVTSAFAAGIVVWLRSAETSAVAARTSSPTLLSAFRMSVWRVVVVLRRLWALGWPVSSSTLCSAGGTIVSGCGVLRERGEDAPAGAIGDRPIIVGAVSSSPLDWRGIRIAPRESPGSRGEVALRGPAAVRGCVVRACGMRLVTRGPVGRPGAAFDTCEKCECRLVAALSTPVSPSHVPPAGNLRPFTRSPDTASSCLTISSISSSRSMSMAVNDARQAGMKLRRAKWRYTRNTAETDANRLGNARPPIWAISLSSGRNTISGGHDVANSSGCGRE